VIRLRRILAPVLAATLLVMAVPPALAVPGDAPRPARKIVDIAPPRTGDLEALVEKVTGGTSQYGVTTSGKQVDVNLSTDVLFEFGKADLTTAASQAIDDAAAIVRARATGAVEIIGHADAVGDDASNQVLSERRAASVEAALRSRIGKPGITYRSSGRGESDPVAPNTTPNGGDNPEGRRLNRRVTVRFTT
jgi:outer membrane protein OmpA-like peptidoglycan-associated protein